MRTNILLVLTTLSTVVWGVPITDTWLQAQQQTLVIGLSAYIDENYLNQYTLQLDLTTALFKPLADESTARFNAYIVPDNDTLMSPSYVSTFCRQFRQFKTTVGPLRSCRYSLFVVSGVPESASFELSYGGLMPLQDENVRVTKPINATNLLDFSKYIDDWFSQENDNCQVLGAVGSNRFDLFTPINYYLPIDCGGTFNPPRDDKFKKANYVANLNPILLRELSLKLVPQLSLYPVSLVDVIQIQDFGSQVIYVAIYRLK